MNIKVVLNSLGKTMLVVAILMLLPIGVGLVMGESLDYGFLISAGIMAGIALPMALLKSDEEIRAREGFVIVALVWIMLSAIGCLPFVIDGAIPNYIDAFFETVSGFTTTGATQLTNVEVLSHSLQFWRIFTHFLGGMGVLVFVLALLPSRSEGMVHIYRAEAPGPSVDKLVPKVRFTARILYLIYIGLTLLETISLLIAGLPLYDSVMIALSGAGTGGFSIFNDSIAHYGSVAVEMIVAVFMILFSINFNVFYLLLIGKVSKALRNEELQVFIIIFVVAVMSIAINITSVVGSFANGLRYSFFQVGTIMSTTGFSSIDYTDWPVFSQSIILALTVFGACAGSTGGGFKISRLLIIGKHVTASIRRTLHPKSVVSVKMDGQPLGEETVSGVVTYGVIWVALVILSTLLLGLEGNGDILTNFTAEITCISNVGPGLGAIVGPAGNYATFGALGKIVLSINMLIGRLEIFPILILFNYNTWRRK